MNSSIRKLSKILITHINKESTYSQGTGNISSFVNKPLQKHIVPTSTIITLFWNKNTLFALVEFSQKICLMRLCYKQCYSRTNIFLALLNNKTTGTTTSNTTTTTTTTTTIFCTRAWKSCVCTLSSLLSVSSTHVESTGSKKISWLSLGRTVNQWTTLQIYISCVCNSPN